MSGYIHIGGKIEDLLEEQHKTKRELADDIGMSAGNVVYLTKRASIDIQMVHKIGNALKYNFFKHFPIDEGNAATDVITNGERKLIEEKDKEIKQLIDKLCEQERLIENLERESVMLKQENGYLKEINELLKGNKQTKK